MKSFVNIIFLSILIFYCPTCIKNVDKEIILKLGKLKINRYEYEKNKNRTFKEDTMKESEVLKWKKDYFDKCLIIADAREKQYDTLPAILNRVRHTSKIMMVQRYGYLWQHRFSPIVDRSKKVTDEKAVKREKLFYFDYISCDHLPALLDLVKNDTILEDLETYNKLKNRCHTNDHLSTGYFSQQWPFVAFSEHTDYLYNMKEGQVSKLLAVQNKYFYFYLDHIETIELTEQDRQNLQTELQHIAEQELINKKTTEMKTKGNPVIHQKHVDSIARFIAAGHSIFDYPNNVELIRYNLDNKTKKVDLNTFREYYTHLPLRKKLRKKDVLIGYINQYFYYDYLSTEAKKLGLYQDEKFLLDQKNFTNNVLYNTYLQKEIINTLTIDSAEVQAYYEDHKMRFTLPKQVTVAIYIFANPKAARENAHKITGLLKKGQMEHTKDPAIIKGLDSFLENYTINLETENERSPEFLNEIQSLEISSLSSKPVPFEGKHVLFYKKQEKGQFTRPLEAVYDQIEHTLEREKFETKRTKILRELREKYPVEIDKTGLDS